MERKKIIRALVVGFSVFLITLVLYYLGVFRVLEWKSWDLRLHLWSNAKKASEDIVVILIDQQSLDAYAEEQGLSWPWPRQMYAYMLDFLRQGGAKAVVFDLIFSEGSVWGVEDDLQFAQAMAQAQNAFIPVFMSKQEMTPGDSVSMAFQKFALKQENLPPQSLYPMKSVSLPIDELLDSCRGVGNVQFLSDKDGIYRRMPLAFSMEERIYPSLPLTVMQFMAEGFDIDNVPLDGSGQMILNYHGPTKIYSAYSAAAVINSLATLRQGQEPQIPLSTFKDKIVLVGGSAPGLLDLRPTPFSPVSPGVGIHATAIDNLLHKEFIRVPSALVVFCVVAILALVAALGTTLIIKIWQLVIFAIIFVFVPALLVWLSFQAGFWFVFVAPEFAVLLSFATATFLNYQVEGRQRRFIKQVFNHYLSPDVIDRIIQNPDLLKLGGDRREITSFFSDVAGFTTISEGLTPEELVDLLNDYLTDMTEIILDSGGTLDKYEGDAIIAFWNAPLDLPDHASRACRAAVECQQRLKELNPRFLEKYGHSLRMRIGLNSGPAVVGNMGSHRRFDYTAMGDTINLAARLEGACKQYGIETLASEYTFEKLQEGIATREVDIIRVVGKKRPVRIYEVLGREEDLSDTDAAGLKLFQRALNHYRSREWSQAEELLQTLDQDPVALTYLRRISDLKDSPLPDDWDGVFDLTKK